MSGRAVPQYETIYCAEAMAGDIHCEDYAVTRNAINDSHVCLPVAFRPCALRAGEPAIEVNELLQGDVLVVRVIAVTGDPDLTALRRSRADCRT